MMTHIKLLTISLFRSKTGNNLQSQRGFKMSKNMDSSANRRDKTK